MVAVIVCCGFFLISVSGPLISALQADTGAADVSQATSQQGGHPTSVSDQLAAVDANLATSDALLAKTGDDMKGPGDR